MAGRTLAQRAAAIGRSWPQVLARARSDAGRSGESPGQRQPRRSEAEPLWIVDR